MNRNDMENETKCWEAYNRAVAMIVAGMFLAILMRIALGA